MSRRAENISIVEPHFTKRRATIGDPVLSQTRSVQDKIDELVRCIDLADRTSLLEAVSEGRAHGRELISSFRSGPYFNTVNEVTPPAYRDLENWYQSEAGQQSMARLTSACTTLISRTVAQGHPGHDRRHICLKDPLSALRFLVEEQINDWRQVFLIGALLHDVGRLPEPRIHGAPASGVAGQDHAFLSFEILRQLLTTFPDIPQTLKEALLFSIAVHQAGKDRENFGAQFVQRADREQLVGAEFLARGIPAGVGFNDLAFAIPTSEKRAHKLELPGSSEETDIAHHIEFYMRNLYPNIGTFAESHAEAGKVVSGIFLKLAHGNERFEQLFAPELHQQRGTSIEHGRFKNVLKTSTWNAIAHAPTVEDNVEIDRRIKGKTVLQLCEELSTLPLAANPRTSPANALAPHHGPTVWQRMERHLMSLSSAEQDQWRRAFAYASIHIDKAAVEDRTIMQGAHALYREQPLSTGLIISNFVERELSIATLRLV